MGEPERRGDERSEAPRSGGSPAFERAVAPTPPDPEVPARHLKRRFTTAYKLGILRRADACTRPGELGALLRKEGLYSSHLVTWRRQREHGLTAKKRGRKPTSTDPRVNTLSERRRLWPPKTVDLSAVCNGRKRSSPSKKKLRSSWGSP